MTSIKATKLKLLYLLHNIIQVRDMCMYIYAHIKYKGD